MNDPLSDIFLRCIVCDKALVRNKEWGHWDDAVGGLIVAGYGSRLDLDYFYVGICDDCAAAKKSSGAIFFAGNGLQSEDQQTEQQRAIVNRYLMPHPLGIPPFVKKR